MTSINNSLRLCARFVVVAITALVLMHSSVAAALDDATQGLLFPLYGENEPMCGVNGSAASATAGKDNEETVFRFFLSKGLTPNQVAGMMGNFRQESGFNPKAQQDGSNDVYPKNTVGYGLAQWTFTSRQQPLVDLAKKKGVLPNTLPIQLEYVWQELTGSYYKPRVLEPLMKIYTRPKIDAVREATLVFHDGFEGSADTTQMLERRIRYSKESLALMIERGVVVKGQEDKVLAGTSPATSGGDPCGADGGTIVVDGYAWPRAPLKKSAYSKRMFPTCKNAVMNGSYTSRGVYRDKYGNSAAIKTCHHDATPAFDLMADGGEAVYAITDGYIVKRSNFYGGVSNCWSIQFKSTKETGGYYYWYGHLQDANQNLPVGVNITKPIAAGTRIASIAKQDKGSACWLGGVHLHIDSGCVDKQGTPRTGGNDGCRRPGFLQELGKLYEALP